MKNLNGKVYVSESMVRDALDNFREEAVKAVGNPSAGIRPRFARFRLFDGIKACIARALKAFSEGEFVSAMEEVKNASFGLNKMERRYCANAPQWFQSKLDALVVDKDIMASLEKKLAGFAEVAKLVDSSQNASLDEASKRYWNLLDSIDEAKREQVARDRKRMDAERRKRVEADAEKDRLAREAQARANAERRQAREKLAEGYSDLLSL